jgi:hypothetical protein
MSECGEKASRDVARDQFADDDAFAAATTTAADEDGASAADEAAAERTGAGAAGRYHCGCPPGIACRGSSR